MCWTLYALLKTLKIIFLPCWNTEVQSCHPRRDPNLQSALHWSFYTEAQQQCMDSCTFTTTGNIALCTHSTAATELCTCYLAIKNLCSANFHKHPQMYMHPLQKNLYVPIQTSSTLAVLLNRWTMQEELVTTGEGCCANINNHHNDIGVQLG